MVAQADPSNAALSRLSSLHFSVVLLVVSALLMIAHSMGVLPAWLVRLPEAVIPPTAEVLDVVFAFVQNDLGLIHVTRSIAAGLEYLLDATGNILYGKNRFPYLNRVSFLFIESLGPIPWSAVAAGMAVLGFWLGGWRMAILAGGTFVWTAMIGQWDIAMQTMSVLIVAAPIAFLIGLMLGIAAWQWRWVDNAIKPILSVLQTLPFFTYLLPAVIFFKVGPTAAAVATIIYAIPPMILMTTLGLQKVSPDIVEAGKMSGCTRWQMLTRVYIPAARTEILVGVNQVIMLCLAMVVLTAFIGMPGLGAKLLAMMNSFKLGRSFEIGVTIVLLAITLDRLSKAWVVKQPKHWERETPWWERHFLLLLGLGAFAAFYIISQFQTFEILNEVGPQAILVQGPRDRPLDQRCAGDRLNSSGDRLAALVPERQSADPVPQCAALGANPGADYDGCGAGLLAGWRKPAIYAAVSSELWPCRAGGIVPSLPSTR